MASWEGYFRGKRITVMGMGLLGGIGDIRFLAEQGAELILTDLKSEEELRLSLEQLREFSNIRYTLGRHDLADFRDRDLVIKAPATPLDSPYIAEAKKNGIPVTMWAALFSRFAREMGAAVVGVTGTRGKTTVTAMLSGFLQAAGEKVIEGGNLPGSSILSKLPELAKDSLVLLELDSWKLQGFAEEKLSPDVAVFTTFYPDHLNFYGGSMDAYLADKAAIFLGQRAGDTLVLGEQCADIVQKKYASDICAQVILARAADLPADLHLSVPGAHNRANAACAWQAARALGIPDEAIRTALERFAGVPGRLEFVREVRGVKFYNDTTATSPDATTAALAALDPSGKQNILLICGGADKGLDMSGMRPAVHAHCKQVFLLSGTGTDRIRADAPDAPVFDSLQKALDAAVAAAQSGDIVLLSPALASFGMFKNEYDRGEQFIQAVNRLA